MKNRCVLIILAAFLHVGCAYKAQKEVVWNGDQGVIDYASLVPPGMTFSVFDKNRVDAATKIVEGADYKELNGYFFTEHSQRDIQNNFERYCRQKLGQAFRVIDGSRLSVCEDEGGSPLFLVRILANPKLYSVEARKTRTTSYELRVIAPNDPSNKGPSYLAAIEQSGYKTGAKVRFDQEMDAKNRQMLAENAYQQRVAERPYKKKLGVELCKEVVQSGGYTATARAFVEQVSENNVQLRVHGHYISNAVKVNIDPYITWSNVDMWDICATR